MKRLLLVALLVSSAYLLMGSTWIRSYSIEGVCPYPYSSSNVQAYNVIPAIGGGYLLQGYAEFSDYEFYVMAGNVFWKVDENGDIVWRKSTIQMGAHDRAPENCTSIKCVYWNANAPSVQVNTCSLAHKC